MKLNDLQFEIVHTLTSIGINVIILEDELFTVQSWEPEVDPFSKIITGYSLVGRPIDKLVNQASALQAYQNLEDKRKLLIPKMDQIQSIKMKVYPDIRWKLYSKI